MLRSVSIPSPRKLIRFLKLSTIVVLGGCAPGQCDDVFEPQVQGNLTGRFTLNSEPIPDVVIASGSERNATDGEGRYSLTITGTDYPIVRCFAIETAPWQTIASDAALFDDCPTFRDDEPVVRDRHFLYEPAAIQFTDPTDGAQLAPGTRLLRGDVGGSMSVNGSSILGNPPVRLSSSVDGDFSDTSANGFGVGGSFAKSVTLSEGSHTLTATFTDWVGNTTTDQISVTVGTPAPNETPTATITSPPSGMAFPGGTALDFAGTGTDPEEGALTGASLAWSSSQEGAIGTGESFSRVMAEGSHVIVLTATDSQGASATDTIFIHMNAVGGGGSGTILGVVSLGGTPLADVPVTLSGPTPRNGATDQNGNYAFEGLAAGTYTITISPPPGTDITTEQTVTITDGETATVNFTG